MALFLSNFKNKIDAKGRLSVPAQYRASFSEQDNSTVVIYESFVNNCIEGCNLTRMQKISEAIDELDPFSKDRDILSTALLGASIQLNMDLDGRIILPSNLIEKYNLGQYVIFVGKGVNFEIWNVDEFDKYMIYAKNEAMDRLKLIKLKK